MASLLHVHGGNLRAAAEKFGIKTEELIDFSANINPLGPSEEAIKAIQTNLQLVAHYPDSECKELKQLLAEDLDVLTENIVMGNGAVELIYILLHMLKLPRVLVPAPTFGEYAIAVKAAGGEVVPYQLKEEEDFLLDIEVVKEQLTSANAVIICNPNNPTGHLTSRNKLENLIAYAAQKKKWVLIDEAFMDFIEDRANFSIVELVKTFPNLFVLYSLTKFYAIPGLRLGAGIGSGQLITKMESAKDPWNVNVLAQMAGLASLRDMAYREKTLNHIKTEKEYLFKQLTLIKGLKPYHPTVNYVFIDISKTGRTSGQLAKALGEKGILIRDCSSYDNLDSRYIRVAVKDRGDNDRLLAALREVLLNEV